MRLLGKHHTVSYKEKEEPGREIRSGSSCLRKEILRLETALCLTSALALEGCTFGFFRAMCLSTGDADVISGTGVVFVVRAVACRTIDLYSGIWGQSRVGRAAVSLTEAGTVGTGFCFRF